MKLFWVWFWLTVGNVTYHSLSTIPRWSDAFSTCWDQGAAILAVALALRFWRSDRAALLGDTREGGAT